MKQSAKYGGDGGGEESFVLEIGESITSMQIYSGLSTTYGDVIYGFKGTTDKGRSYKFGRMSET